MTVTLQDPDPTVFAPFGVFLKPPARVGDRLMFSEWLEPVQGMSQQCHLNRVAPSTLPLMVEQVESHPHAAQVFLPMQVSRYLVTVMPSDAAGSPDTRHAMTFVVPGTLGVVYHPGTWHAGMTVLDEESSFVVLMWRGGDEDDIFTDIPPIKVLPQETDPLVDHGELSSAEYPE